MSVRSMLQYGILHVQMLGINFVIIESMVWDLFVCDQIDILDSIINNRLRLIICVTLDSKISEIFCQI